MQQATIKIIFLMQIKNGLNVACKQKKYSKIYSAEHVKTWFCVFEKKKC